MLVYNLFTRGHSLPSLQEGHVGILSLQERTCWYPTANINTATENAASRFVQNMTNPHSTMQACVPH